MVKNPKHRRLLALWHKLRRFVGELLTEFDKDDCMDISAALSYYMAFSIAPILFLLVQVAGAVFGEEAISGEIYIHTKDLVGETAASVIQSLLQNAYVGQGSWWATLIGIVTVLLGATTVFAVLHSSLNKIWHVNRRERKAFVLIVWQRALGLFMILLIGLLFMAMLVANAVLDIIYERFAFLTVRLPAFVDNLRGQALTYSSIGLLFLLVFKFLSDARLRWRTAFAGALFTTLLFALGKEAIGYYLTRSSLGAVYGAASSLAVLLTWVYYSSAIFLLGAEFIKVYARRVGDDLNS